MSTTAIIEEENFLRAQNITTRLNVVIAKLNMLAKQNAEYEHQYSIYITEYQKLNHSVLTTKEDLKVIEELLDEEKTLRLTLKNLSALNWIKKQRTKERLAEIARTIETKQAQLDELKKQQQTLTINVNCAKHNLSRLSHASILFHKIVEKEYNPLVQNLNAISNLNLKTLSDDYIGEIEPLEITLINSKNEENEDEIIY